MGIFVRKKKTIAIRGRHGRDDLYYRYQNLSEMWREYAELLLGGDKIGKERQIADAMNQAAHYKRSAISIEEELLLKEEDN